MINGNKIFTSGADQADYIWLAARTDPDAPKHKGISIFLRAHLDPRASRGRPIVTVGGVATTASYYDNVRVPTSALVGELNEGWRLITGQLNHERVGLAAVSALAQRLWAEAAEWVVDARAWPTSDWVQVDLARTYAAARGPEACSTGAWRPRWPTTRSVRPTRRRSRCSAPSRPSRSTAACWAWSGPAGYLSPGSPGAVLHGELERAGRQAQINTFGGGVNEVQREILAMAGLGMKRSSR